MSTESTVISLVPIDINEEKPGLFPGRYKIPASDMRIPSILHVSHAKHFVYLDESRGSLGVPSPSDQVAKSIVDDWIESQLGIDEDSRPALFWVPDELSKDMVIEKFKVEIAKRLLSQRRWFLNLAMLADNDWTNYHKHNVISAFQRKCADIIGWNPIDHEWMAPMTTMESTPCPFCGNQVPKGFSRCGNCKEVINPRLEKEIQAKMATL
jgi:hypothetical protein